MKRKRYLTEDGMTFIELLLVLLIISVISLIVLPLVNGWTITQTETDGLEAFKTTVHHMQSYAMANNTTTWLSFSDEGRTYTITYSDKAEKTVNQFPPTIRLDSSSTFYTFGFQPNGDMFKTGTLALTTSKGAIKIKFQFQRGRMIIGK